MHLKKHKFHCQLLKCFRNNNNNHMPTAKENKLIFIQKTGHTYQQKEQEIAEDILKVVKEFQGEHTSS